MNSPWIPNELPKWWTFWIEQGKVTKWRALPIFSYVHFHTYTFYLVLCKIACNQHKLYRKVDPNIRKVDTLKKLITRSDGTCSSINSTEKVSKYKNKRTGIFLVWMTVKLFLVWNDSPIKWASQGYFLPLFSHTINYQILDKCTACNNFRVESSII
jgi:hypothetical protein